MPDLSVTLVDQFAIAGSYGYLILITALLLGLLGVVFVFTRPPLPLRRAYLLACFLPCGLGVLGFVVHFTGAFAVLSHEGSKDFWAFFAFLSEVILTPSLGFIASGISLILAGMVWLRSEKPAR